MDLSGEVAKIHMRTDAKNLVTRTRTIHLLEQNETSHIISWLRKGALFREYSRPCSHSNSELFGRLLDEGISEGRQLDHSGDNSEVARC